MIRSLLLALEGNGQMQRSFAELDGFRKQRKTTRREAFLVEMERVISWQRLEALIEPVYPTAGSSGPYSPCNGCPIRRCVSAVTPG